MFSKYFLDPIYSAPTIGCLLVCVGISFVGVVAFLRSRSLVGESLAHASYPGILLGMLLASYFDSANSLLNSVVCVVFGGVIFALLGLFLIGKLQSWYRVPSDSALCFVLSSFFGFGVLLASSMQYFATSSYQKSQAYLYGHAATMTYQTLPLYGVLTLLIISQVILFYKEIKILCFDSNFAASVGLNLKIVDTILAFLLAFSIVLGMRSVGLVMVSAMLIAPAIAARQFTDRLSRLFWLSAFFGALSGFFGNVLSVESSLYFSHENYSLSFPTGPMIVLVSCILCLFSLLFAPKRGVVFRLIRKELFRFKCLQENLVKAAWRCGDKGIDLSRIKQLVRLRGLMLWWVLSYLERHGWFYKISKSCYGLTKDGNRKAEYIVRLHRLWEVYLVEYLGIGAERVHCSAEEIEHILTPELEKELTDLLEDPKKDPHNQPIPKPSLKI
jgi:manganese/zinc/iron transport system permease protein